MEDADRHPWRSLMDHKVTEQTSQAYFPVVASNMPAGDHMSVSSSDAGQAAPKLVFAFSFASSWLVDYSESVAACSGSQSMHVYPWMQCPQSFAD